MQCLKEKLAAAGLVTRSEIEALERRGKGSKEGSKEGSKKQPEVAGKGGGGPRGPRLDLRALEAANKGARYDAIRRAVEAHRLDSAGPIPSATAEVFHFATQGGPLGRLDVEPPVQAALAAGEAGIIAFMSNHGLAHAVVPATLAADVGGLFPLWLRVLKDHPGAGQVETPGA